ncbi:MAG: response regulator [Rhodospirillales bacterium]|nr:MAG: response regulator [Rhodospirillales bacterium]
MANRIRILLVDDSRAYAHLVIEAIQRTEYDCEIEHVSNGQDALKRLQINNNDNEQPGIDLILTDIHMPKMSGFDLLKEIKSHHRLTNIPVAMLSTNDEHNAYEISMGYGADMFMNKPMTFTQLVDMMTEMLRKLIVCRKMTDTTGIQFAI